MRTRLASCLTPVILSLLSSAPLAAQQTAPAFRAEANLVLVPVVVRDAKGEVLANLTKADFRLFDNGKEQAITSFSVEETTGQVAQDRSQTDANAAPGNGGAPDAQPKAAAMVIPEHYVALLFDDQHIKNCDPDPPPGYIGCVGDLWHGRDAARKMIKTLKPVDRVGVFTSSGDVMLDFTADRAKIEEALMKLREGKPVLPTVANSGLRGREVEEQTHEAVNWCGDLVRRMSHLPGQRTLVFVSPGLLLHGSAVNSWSEVGSTMNLIDNAIRSRVVINSLDARGLTYERAGTFWEFQQRVTDGTGGTFIRDTNDLNGSMERLAATPKYIYVLGFSPQDIKQDGSFHHLTVKLREGHNLDIQARASYAAPDAKELARQQSRPAATSAAAAPQVSEVETQQVAQALGIAADAQNASPPAPQRAADRGLATFHAETNLVLVPVVVRDTKGNEVGGLSKGDFQLLRDGESQTIASFSVEETSGRAVEDRDVGGAPKASPMVMPEHFAALMFDDAHFEFQRPEDIAYPRNAALKYLDTLQPGDRVALFTSSGQNDVDFTADRAKIRDALMKITPAPPAFFGMQAEQVARLIISQCDKIVSRMALLPGQRTLVFVSSGVVIQQPMEWSAVPETMRMVDHAIRSRVVISAMDTRGLAMERPTSRAWEFQLDVSDGTGGKFIRDTNDLDGAVQQLAATPKFIYVLGFSAEGGKSKNGFHKLEVKLREGRKLDVQARNGYYDAGTAELAEASKAPAAKTETLVTSEADTRELMLALDVAPAPPSVGPSKAPGAVTAPAAPSKNDEMTTTEQPATFKVQSNLVEVPVIVRDRAGKAIGNLKQEDFRILDKGKRQEVTKFAVVKAAGPTGPAAETRAETPPPGAPARAVSSNPSAGSAAPPAVPTRFVAFVFDDLHMLTEDLPQVRAAVLKYVDTSLQPGDRVALFTTSGQQGVDFTDRPDVFSASLNKVSPSPLAEPDLGGCGDAHVSYFQAVQVDREVGLEPMASDVSKSLALRVAIAEFKDFRNAVIAIRDAYTSGLQESRATLAALRAVVQRMAAMPGQRSVLLVSPGFFLPSDVQNESDALMALAIRSKVLISSVDARGVWTNPVFSACKKDGMDGAAVRDETTFKSLEGQANTDALIALAEDTGGTANLNNDFFGGVQKAAAAPEYMYVLGFVPQDLKLDGSFHGLKVTLGSAEKLSLQARRGYWAPKHAEDEAAISKQEIEDAVFSRDEVHGLPVDMHTRWTKVGEQAKLTVLTSVDLKAVHLRKAEDRNRNELTIVAALFDTNGNFVAGVQKLVQLRLRDETVAGLQQKPPVVIGTDFDVKPGGYLVRLVVRDAEGQQITAENAAVQVQ